MSTMPHRIEERPARKLRREPNGKTSKVRACFDHVVARRIRPISVAIRTIGLAGAKMKIGLADITHATNRAIWPTTRAATA